MHYYRHLGLLMAIPRLCLLIVGSIGLDIILESIEGKVGAHERYRLGWILLALLVATAGLLATVGYSYVLPQGFYVKLINFPAAFGSERQVLGVSVLVSISFAVILLSGKPIAARSLAVAAMMLTAIEVTSYFTVIFWSVGSQDTRAISGFFRRSPLVFQPVRELEMREEEKPVSDYLTDYIVRDPVRHNELCYPVGRRDARLLDVDELLAARPGPKVESPYGTGIEPSPTDAPLRSVIGCGSPKLRLVREVQFVPTESDAIRFVGNDPRFGRVPVLICPRGAKDRCGELGKESDSSEPAVPVSDASVQVTDFRSNSLRAEVSAGERAAWLVYADSWFPWWKAYIDGKAVQVYRSDLAFKAVAVPPGRHEIQFKYWHTETGVGYPLFLLLSTLTWVGASVWLIRTSSSRDVASFGY
jgi:hypothetical protein